jgi:hypothetical protein
MSIIILRIVQAGDFTGMLAVETQGQKTVITQQQQEPIDVISQQVVILAFNVAAGTILENNTGQGNATDTPVRQVQVMTLAVMM